MVFLTGKRLLPVDSRSFTPGLTSVGGNSKNRPFAALRFLRVN
jgi:hypothetical protein